LYSILRYEFIEKIKARPLPDSVELRVKHLENVNEITVKDGVIEKVKEA